MVRILTALFLVVTPSFAEQHFSEQYERDNNIFNPACQYAPDNPFNPANRYNASTPFVVIPDLEEEEMRQGDFLSVECV